MTAGRYADSAQAREQDEAKAAPVADEWDDPAFVEQCRATAAQDRQKLPGRIAQVIEQMERRLER